MAARRYAVTGAAGFIGSHLTEALLARGDEVVAIDAFTEYYDPARKERNASAFDVVRADLLDAPLDDLFADVDGIFHLAGQPGVRSSFRDFEVYLHRNVLATQRLLEAARTRVVLASSSSVYGDAETYPTPESAVPRPISPYGVTKLACEQLASAYGTDTVTLRYFTVYGPRQRPDMAFARLVDAAIHEREFELYGDAARPFTFVADAVDATMAAMDAAPAGAVYNVGGVDVATMTEAIAILERVSETNVRVRRADAARGDARKTAADVTKIGAELGWAPTTALEDGLRAQWVWAADRVAAR